ncbi:hypothetical protein [Streptomyces sp. C8S0]|uniref:hypothetical protein n=1 Tax=Streptomyces sp. C8S0 TaxID=2585716 RepID=UPI00125DAB5A|nr:hypothetical protein [Streptomyces sp. C8S0]
MACEVGLAENRFDWPRAADLLRAMAERRLPADDSGQQHRAAAVALALLGPVAGAEDLAALAGAISALPPEPYRLSVLLDDLADAGLADAAPYSVRPALLAPVLVADALDPRSRVRLDAGRALDVLLNRAGLGAGRLDAVPVGEHLVFSGAGLGSQLNTLAQAAHDRPDAGPGHGWHRRSVGCCPARQIWKRGRSWWVWPGRWLSRLPGSSQSCTGCWSNGGRWHRRPSCGGG